MSKNESKIAATSAAPHEQAGEKTLKLLLQQRGFVCAKWGLIGFSFALAVIILYAIWVAFNSGTSLPEIPFPLGRTENTIVATASVHLTMEMNPVRLKVRETHREAHNGWYMVTVTDPRGHVIARRDGGMIAAEGAKRDRKVSHFWDYGVFNVSADGEHVIRFSAVGPVAADFETAGVALERNSVEAHFFRNFMLLIAAFAGSVWWWKRRYYPAKVLDAAVADNDGRASKTPVTGGMPEMSSGQRFLRRAALEGLEFLVSAARVPLFGAYAMLITMSVFAVLADTTLGSADILARIAESPGFVRLLTWFFPPRETRGMAVLIELGQAAGIVTLALFVLTLPFRLLLEDRPHPTFRQRAKRLFLLNVGFIGLLALAMLFAREERNNPFWEVIGMFTMLSGLLYIPSLLFIAILSWLDSAIVNLERRG